MKMSQQHQSTVRALSARDLYDYFYPRPVPPWKFGVLIVGIILILVGLFVSQIFIVIGVLIGGIGVFIICKQIKSRPDDESYDAWLRERAQDLYERSLEMLDIRPGGRGQSMSIRSLVLPGSMEANEYRDGEALIKRGKDGRLRFSINVYTFIFCTPRFLAVFKSDINAFQPYTHIDAHNIYPYSKIFGAVATQSEDIVILNEQKLPYRMEQFCLELTNGQKEVMSATVRARPRGNMPGAPMIMPPGSNFDKKLSRLRQILLAY
jgi:hypothetical protein